MANFTSILDPLEGLTNDLSNRLIADGFTSQAAGTSVMTSAPVPHILRLFLNFNITPSPSHGDPSFGGNMYGAVKGRDIQDDWFERVHVLPRAISLGNILSSVTTVIDIFNADRRLPHTFTGWVNNAGAGTTISDLPSLPATMGALDGIIMHLVVSPEGPASVHTTLEFDFDLYAVNVPIDFSRIVMFPFRPELPLVERLRFLTDVMEKKSGIEMRVSNRKAPRQEFDLVLLAEDGPERQRIQYLLFDWQSRIFGLPMWQEPAYLSSNASSGGTSLNLGTTSYGDWRVGSLGIIYVSETSFETFQITSVGPTTINLNSALANNWPAGTEVYPLRVAYAASSIRKERYPKALGRFTLTMKVVDNDTDLSSTAAFSLFNGKVVVADPNAIEGTLQETLERRIYELDGLTGKFSQATAWDVSRSGSAKTFVSRTRQRLWEIRQLLHALKGRQVSFYLPTFYQDLTAASALVNGTASLVVTNVGYTKYAQSRQPMNVIRVVLKTGTIHTRTVLSSSEVDAATESLLVDSTWPATIQPSEIDRIEVMEKVRMDTDDVTIVHSSSLGDARIGFPVKAVLE